MLELLWVDNEQDAKSQPAAGLHILERWKGRGVEASPFGVCLRATGPAMETVPFADWSYRPRYLAPPRFIHIGENSASIREPLIFYQSLTGKPAHAVQPAGFQQVTELRIFSPSLLNDPKFCSTWNEQIP